MRKHHAVGSRESGHKELWVLRALQGSGESVWSGAEQPKGEAWQVDRRNAGVRKSAGTVQQRVTLHSVRKLPAFKGALGWGHGGLWGAKQAQGWVPTSRVSPGLGGWVCAGSRGRRCGDSGDIALETF